MDHTSIQEKHKLSIKNNYKKILRTKIPALHAHVSPSAQKSIKPRAMPKTSQKVRERAIVKPKAKDIPRIRNTIIPSKWQEPIVKNLPTISNTITPKTFRKIKKQASTVPHTNIESVKDSFDQWPSNAVKTTIESKMYPAKEKTMSSKKKTIQEIVQGLKVAIMKHAVIFVIKIARNDTYLLAYIHHNGNFVKILRDDFRLFLNRLFLDRDDVQYLTRSHITELWDVLVSEPSLQGNIDDFDADQPHWNCKNGVILMDRKEDIKLVPHSPEYRFKSFLRGQFLKPNAYAKPKKFIEVLKRNFPDKSMRKLFLQAFAYLLSWNGSSKVFFYLLGESDTGKSMFLKLLRHFIGSDAISELPIEKLSERFSASYLSDKRVNICGEVEHSELKKSSFLKSIVGQDVQVAEFKGKNHFSFVPRVRLIFSANDMLEVAPQIAEDALFRRIIFIEFLNPMPKDEQIFNFDKILYEEEGDAIFTYLAKVYHEWLNNGRKFEVARRSTELKKDFVNQKGPIEQFVADCCVLNEDGRELTIDLYGAYEKFCCDNCLDTLSRGKFSRELRMLSHRLGIKGIRFRKEGENPQYGYAGISLKDP